MQNWEETPGLVLTAQCLPAPAHQWLAKVLGAKAYEVAKKLRKARGKQRYRIHSWLWIKAGKENKSQEQNRPKYREDNKGRQWGLKGQCREINYCRIASLQLSLIFFKEHLCWVRFLSLGNRSGTIGAQEDQKQCHPLLKSRMLQDSEVECCQQKSAQQQPCFKPTAIKRARSQRERSRG